MATNKYNAGYNAGGGALKIADACYVYHEQWWTGPSDGVFVGVSAADNGDVYVTDAYNNTLVDRCKAYAMKVLPGKHYYLGGHDTRAGVFIPS